MMPEPARDAPSFPLFSPHIEAKAMEALNVLIVVHGGDGKPIPEDRLAQLHGTVTRLVDCLFPIKGDSADFSGADSLDGSDYIHPIKVAALAAVIGRTMGMPRSALISLAMAAALMNVGYLALRRSLLDEPRRLLDGEWEQHVRTHPDQGVVLLARSGLPDDCLHAIAQHHERWDGSGYPGRARGEAIVRNARILAVADSYVSLRSLRPYREAVDADEALREIAGDSGKLFDPQVVEAFEEVVSRYTGIMRPERATAGRRAGAAAREEGHEAQRDGIDRTGGPPDASKPVRDAGDDVETQGAQTRARRTAAPAAQRADGALHAGAGRGRAPTPPGGTAAGSTADAPARPSVAVPLAPAPPPPPPARPRRRAPRRRSTLFAPGLYVDAAVRGRWAPD